MMPKVCVIPQWFRLCYCVFVACILIFSVQMFVFCGVFYDLGC